MTRRNGDDLRGPRNDVLHDEDGNHRKDPPPGVNRLTWEVDMRKHLEGHGLDEMVSKIAPRILPPKRPRF